MHWMLIDLAPRVLPEVDKQLWPCADWQSEQRPLISAVSKVTAGTSSQTFRRVRIICPWWVLHSARRGYGELRLGS